MLGPENKGRKNHGLLIREFDENFNLFHELMPHKIRQILLVSTPYDAFVLEEDGSLAGRIINEYHGLNLSAPPRLTHVAKASDALALLGVKNFDLVLTMPFVGEMDAFALGKAIKQIKARLPVIMLTANHHSLEYLSAAVDRSGIDRIYVWTGDANLLLAIIKNVEDHANVKNDTRLAMVRIILLIEDSPFALSSFLPLLYREVVRQTQAVLDESLNKEHQLLKMRARPKILVASSYEEAMKIFKQYRAYLFCVMSDTRFFRHGRLDDQAGVRFLRYLRTKVPDLPLLLMSTEKSNRLAADQIPALFVDKNSPGLLTEIEGFFLDYLGFGDFVFRLPDGTEVGRVKNFQELEARIPAIPEESLAYHGARNHFSNWIMARSEIGLATMLSKVKIDSFTSIDAMREYLCRCIHSFRKWRQLGVISSFSANDFDPRTIDFVKIGKGSLGGKARGLAFLASLLRERQELRQKYSAQPLKIPKTCVIANDGFTSFIEENQLYYLYGSRNDAMIARKFLAVPLPAWLRQDLAAFLLKVSSPLAIRSSSLLEDLQFRPYAGLYKTYMLPNNNPDFQVRLAQLENAIKLVYASTYYEAPRAFSKSIGQHGRDSMAVIIQQLVGRDYDGYFYPACSGVALSYNFYPISYMKREDGIVSLALGFGKTIVEGGRCLRFSPKYPKILPQFSTVDDILKNSQRLFYVLEMAWQQGNRADLADGLLQLEVVEAPESYPLVRFCSTYIEAEHRIRDTVNHGSRVVTFAHILKYNNYPLPEIITDILALGERGMGCPVEVEFAVDLNDQDEATFYLLQIRPLAIGFEGQEVIIQEPERQQAFCRTLHALGHKKESSLADIIMVKRDCFSFKKAAVIAREISAVNARLLKQNRRYLLIGPGRWGSADPLLGIPVQWPDISGVGTIVELVDQQAVEPSQGTHFFQNITSLGIPYLTIKDDADGLLDWSWLARQQVVEETEHLLHLRLPRPFTVLVNGKTSEGVIHAEPS